MSVRRGAVQGGGRAAQRSHLPLPHCQKAMGSPFFARAQFDQRALTVEGDTAPLCVVRAHRPRVLQALRHAAVLLAAQRHAGGRRTGDLRRSQRFRADRAHLGLGKDRLGEARRRPAAISGRSIPLRYCGVAFDRHPMLLTRCCTTGWPGRCKATGKPGRRAVNISFYDLSVWVLPLRARHHLPRGRARLCRAPARRQHRLAARPRQLQPAQAYRSRSAR